MKIKKKVPELRFPEFSGEWEEKRLGELVNFYKGKGISKSDLLEQGIPCILYGELYTTYGEVINNVKSKTELKENLFMSKINDVIIPSSGETAEDISCASVVLLDNIALGGDLNILRPIKSIDGSFLSYTLNSSKKKDIARVAQGISVIHVYEKGLKQLNINIPSVPEQQKIGNFFSTLDKRIELQQQKVENLEKEKKGIMQKIFSQEIRFKDEDGNDYPEWKKSKLGNLCKITTGKLDANAMVEDGKYKFFTCAREDYYIDDYAFNTEALIVAGNGDIGHIKYYKGKFNAYQRTYVLDDFTQNILFVKNYMDLFFKQWILKEVQMGSMPYIKLKTLTDFKIRLPQIEEQQKIANFLSSFDEKIEIEKEILETLKELKKGLLQQMFV